MQDIILSMFRWALESFDSSIDNATKILLGEIASNRSIDHVWGFVERHIMPVFTGFAMTIIAICLLIELAQVAARVDVMKMEIGIRLAVKLVLAKVAVENAPTLLLAMWRQAGVFVKAARPAVSSFGDGIYEYISELAGTVNGTTASIGLFGSTIVLVLALAFCGLIITVMAYGRFFEILVYVAVSPIPIAFFPLGTGDGSGFSRITARFLKSFAAVCLQGAMMLVCIYVFSLLLGAAADSVPALNLPPRPPGSPNTNASEWLAWSDAYKLVSKDAVGAINNAMFAMLVGAIVLVMSVTKCGAWAKSLLDAG